MSLRVDGRIADGIRMDITYKDLELQTTFAKSLNVPLFLATICWQSRPGRVSNPGKFSVRYQAEFQRLGAFFRVLLALALAGNQPSR
jgi:hypothetical protein